MSVKLEDAKVKLKRADRYLKFSIVLFVIFMIVATGVVSYQLYALQEGLYAQQKTADARAKADKQAAQDRLEAALEDNKQQHRQTQAYIKCIANALLTPLSQRSEEVFDQCGIEAATASPVTPTTSQGPVVLTPPQSQPKKPSSQGPTTSSPPDPDIPAPQPDRGTPTFLDRVLGLVGVR